MAIRTRSSEGYQQVELTSELLHSQSGATQQVISAVPCTKHLPFFLSVLLADVFLFGSVLLFAIYAAQYGDGFSLEKQPEAPYRQFNLHALVMLTALVYLNGQAITVYKSNYLVKHKSINMLYHFLLHLLTICGILAGLYLTYSAQEAVQHLRPRVSHFYSVHSWTGLVAIGLFAIQVSATSPPPVDRPIDQQTNRPTLTNPPAQFMFGFFSFFVTLCCRKLTARIRARALPIHRTFAMLVLCASMSAVISGLSQLARFQLNGLDGRLDYRDLPTSALLVNLSAVCVLASSVLIFFITFIFKRRQAHDLPVLFKIILLVTQFVEIVLILVVAEFIFQLVTPHVNRVINSQFIGNTTLTHIFNNATQTINTFISTATQQLGGAANSLPTQSAAPTTTTTVAPTSALDQADGATSVLAGANATS